MAIGIDALEAFTILKSEDACLDHILMLGRQHFMVDPVEVLRRPSLESKADLVARLKKEGDGFSEGFFHELGAKTVESIDFSDYEGCSLTHDLNKTIPESWHERAVVVFDGGTLEHVFHFPNAITNAMNLVKVGGYYVSSSPSNNYAGHGFYQFSPELYYRLFDEANGFEIVLMAVAEARWGGRVFKIANPKELGHRITFGGMGPLQVILIARRHTSSEILSQLPSQSDYAQTWESGTAEEDSGSQSVAPGISKQLKKRIRGLLPPTLLQDYDQFRVRKRHEFNSMRGLSQVTSLSECLRKSECP